MLNEDRLYSISLGVASLQDGLVGVATALSLAMAGHFKFLLHHFFVRLGLTDRRVSSIRYGMICITVVGPRPSTPKSVYLLSLQRRSLLCVMSCLFSGAVFLQTIGGV